MMHFTGEPEEINIPHEEPFFLPKEEPKREAAPATPPPAKEAPVEEPVPV